MYDLNNKFEVVIKNYTKINKYSASFIYHSRCQGRGYRDYYTWPDTLLERVRVTFHAQNPLGRRAEVGRGQKALQELSQSGKKTLEL